MDHTKVQPNISKLFHSAEETTEPEVVHINGSIPEWVRGSLLQIGPGLLDLSPTFSLNNWLDGYGIISKFEINDGPVVKLQTKFVQTEAYTKSVAAGKPFFTEYGTVAQSAQGTKSLLAKIVSTFSRDDMSDNCSASLYKIGSHLCASAPTCYFYEIDPNNLTTGERYDAKKYFNQNGFGVHPLVDDQGNMWNMGFNVLPTFKYNIVKFPTASTGPLEPMFEKAKTVASISSRWNGAFALNHSFGMTSNYIIFIEQPYIVKVSRVLTAQVKGYAVKDWLEYRPADKNKFYCIEKHTGRIANSNLEILSSEAFFFLHIVNCYEDGNQIILDVAASKDPSATEELTLTKLRGQEVRSGQEIIECSKIQRFIIPLFHDKNNGGSLILKDIPENRNLIENLVENSSCKASAVRKGNTLILSPDDMTSKGVERLSINPQFRGKKYIHVFAAGTFLSVTNNYNNKNCMEAKKVEEKNQFLHSVCKINLETKEIQRWFKSPFHFPGEPLFISSKKQIDHQNQDDDDGVVLCPVQTVDPDENNFLLFLDAKTFRELGRATFKNKFVAALHGIWHPV